jgi:hypothetical protein
VGFDEAFPTVDGRYAANKEYADLRFMVAIMSFRLSLFFYLLHCSGSTNLLFRNARKLNTLNGVDVNEY